MTTQAIATSQTIQELQLNPAVQGAVARQSSADFGMLMALMSSDFALPNDFAELANEAQDLNIAVSPEPKPLGDDETRSSAARISEQFHQGGLASAKLQHGLTPDALAYQTPEHQGLGEDVFHNLGYHQRQALTNASNKAELEPLVNKLIVNRRQAQLAYCA